MLEIELLLFCEGCSCLQIVLAGLSAVRSWSPLFGDKCSNLFRCWILNVWSDSKAVVRISKHRCGLCW